MKIQVLNGKNIDVHHFVLGAVRHSVGIRCRLGQYPLKARQQPFSRRRPWTPILSQLTENRDRCEFHVATINPSASDPQGASAQSAQPRPTRPVTSVSTQGISACEPLEIMDCAPAATQRAEEGIGRLDGAIK